MLEGLTDAWYVEAVAALFRDAGLTKLNEKIALVTANSAGKVVYFATILTAHGLKVAALLDSDAAGDNAAKQDVLVHSLKAKGILRTKDYVEGIAKAEIEDLLRDTLPLIAREEFGTDVVDAAAGSCQPLVDMLSKTDGEFSKYRLAKAFVRWSRDNDASSLSHREREGWTKLLTAINASFR